MNPTPTVAMLIRKFSSRLTLVCRRAMVNATLMRTHAMKRSCRSCLLKRMCCRGVGLF